MVSSNQDPNLPIDQNAVNIATSAFIYGLPLVLVDITKEQSLQKGGEVNEFSNMSQFVGYGDKVVVRPNCDTFYSSVFLDLSERPLIMNIPITDAQYYMMPLLDAFTNVIEGSPGTRTKQTQGGKYLLVGPSAGIPNGTNTTGFTIVECPTDLVWAIGRFQVNNQSQDDYAAYGGAQVSKLQSLLSITNLNGNSVAYDILSTDYPQEPVTQTPNQIIATMPISDFFNRLNGLLVNNPPASADASAMQQFATIGVGPNQTFSIDIYNPETRIAMDKIPTGFIATLTTAQPTLTETNWSINLNPEMGNYGTDYNLRAGVAYNGLGANLVADAVYYSANADSEGNKLNSEYRYKLKFNPIPPQNAFWSLTMYDFDGLFIENSIDRYGVGHDSAYPLVTEQEGSVVIDIQKEVISDKEYRFPNWLPSPTPNADFNVMIRVYWPDPSVIVEGSPSWIPPAIVKVS